MGVKRQRRREVKRVFRAGSSLRPRLNWQAAVRLLATLFMLIGSMMPSWHQANAKEPLSSDLSQLRLLPGMQPEEVEASICRHGGGNTSGIPDHDQTQSCKNCPCCIAFHQFPFIPQPGIDCPTYERSAVVAFPYRQELASAREAPGQKRPRAPPLL